MSWMEWGFVIGLYSLIGTHLWMKLLLNGSFNKRSAGTIAWTGVICGPLMWYLAFQAWRGLKKLQLQNAAVEALRTKAKESKTVPAYPEFRSDVQVPSDENFEASKQSSQPPTSHQDEQNPGDPGLN